MAATHASKTYWIVVADEARAIVYTRDTRRGPLTESFSLENEAGRRRPRELESDRGGRSFDSFGAGRHSMAKERSGLKKSATDAFAKHIAERIGKAIHNGRCRGYALIAPPRFLGMLRAALTSSCHVEPFATIDKEVVGKDTGFIKKLVDEG